MAESKPKPANEPGLEIKPAKDLEPDEAQGDSVRGGGAGIGKSKLWSDATLKLQVAPLGDVMARLREIRS